jgi:hypothetical protein
LQLFARNGEILQNQNDVEHSNAKRSAQARGITSRGQRILATMAFLQQFRQTRALVTAASKSRLKREVDRRPKRSPSGVNAPHHIAAQRVRQAQSGERARPPAEPI